MTRKDYIILADALRRTDWREITATIGARGGLAPLITQGTVAGLIADALAADNPRFDRSRFLAACGVAPAPVTTGAEG